MNPNPTVSVVIPTRNRPQLLRRALSSVAHQTYHDLEDIVVDDGSEPPVKEPSCGSIPLTLLRHPSRRGGSSARNSGLEVASGKFVAFLDDDDEWTPEKIGRQVRLFGDASDDVALVHCGYDVRFTPTGVLIESVRPGGSALTTRSFLRRTHFGCSVPLLRRAAVMGVGGFDPGLEGMQDRDLWFRLRRRHEFAADPAVLVTCHVHGAQISTDLGAKVRAKAQFLSKYRLEFAADPGAYAHHCRRLSLLRFAAGDRTGALEMLAEARTRGLRWLAFPHGIASRVLPAAHARYVRTRFKGSGRIRLYS